PVLQAMSIDSELPVTPFAQVIAIHPHAPVPRGQHGPAGPRQTFASGKRGNGKVPKTIEAAGGGDPDVAFTILKQAETAVAGKAIEPRKHIHNSPMSVEDTSANSADPQTTIAIPEKLRSGKRAAGRKRIRLQSLIVELPEARVSADPERAIVTCD